MKTVDSEHQHSLPHQHWKHI